jgi:hypothetical protein
VAGKEEEEEEAPEVIETGATTAARIEDVAIGEQTGQHAYNQEAPATQPQIVESARCVALH